MIFFLSKIIIILVDLLKDRASLVSCLDNKGYNEISVASSGNAAISLPYTAIFFKLKCTVFYRHLQVQEKKNI